MKKRVIAMALCLVMLFNSFPLSRAADSGSAEAVCEVCGGQICVCDIWDRVGDTQDICLIGFLDKSREEIQFFNDEPNVRTLAAADCPDYLILSAVYNSAESGEALFYTADSFDGNFYENVLSYHSHILADMFTEVVPAAGLYATVMGEGQIALYADPADAASAVMVDAAQIAGEYVISEFRYDPEDPDNWFFALTPDSDWPEAAQDCRWISSGYVTGLSRTAAQQPETVEKLEASLEGIGTISVGGTFPAEAAVVVSGVDSTLLDGLEETEAFAFDVAVINADGTHWQPATGETVSVSVPIPETLAHEGTVDVVHFLEDGEKIRELLEAGARIDILEVPDELSEALAPAIAGYREAIEGTQELNDDPKAQKVAVELFENVEVVDGVAQVESSGFSIYVMIADKYYSQVENWAALDSNTVYYIKAGESIRFANDYGNNYADYWGKIDEEAVVTMTREEGSSGSWWNRYEYDNVVVTVSDDAATGTQFILTHDGKTVTFEVISRDTSIEESKGSAVIIAILEDMDAEIPAEPQNVSASFLHYTAQGELASSGDYLPSNETGFVHEEQIKTGDYQGDLGDIFGIIDTTGANKTLQYIDLSQEVIDDIVQEYYEYKNLDGNPEDYKLIIYVVKYARRSGFDETKMWHINGKVVKKSAYLLSYAYNPPEHFTEYDKSAGTMPSTQQVDVVSGGDTTAKVASGAGLKLKTKVDGKEYTATFVGWNTSPNANPADYANSNKGGDGGWYAANDTIVLTGDTTLYAIWETDYEYLYSDIELHKIVANEDGTSADTDMEDYFFTFEGTIAESGLAYNIYNAAGNFESSGTLTNDNRKFSLKNGWYIRIEEVPNGKYSFTEDEKNGYTQRNGPTIELDFSEDNPDGEEIEYFYNVKLQTYMITYMSNDSPVAVSDLMLPDTQTTLVEPPVNDGWVFQGWKCDVADCICGTTLHTAGEAYTMPAQNVEMTAQWKYEVRFDKNFGTDNTVIQTIPAAKDENITFPAAPAREGYSFTGWYDAPTGGNRLDSPDGTATYPVTGPATIYAQWADNRMMKQIRIGMNLFYHCNAEYIYEGSGATTPSYQKYPNEPATLRHVIVRAYNPGNVWTIPTNKEDNVYLEGYVKDYVAENFFSATDVVVSSDGTIGIADPTGEKVKAILTLQESDYEEIAKAWILWAKDYFKEGVAYSDAWGNKATSAVDWSDVDPDGYKALPYVIKYQSNGNWFIDMVVIPKDKYTLGYDRNLENGYVLPSDQKFPETTTHNEGDTADVVDDPDVTPTKTVDGKTYKATFLYWVDEDGNKYGGGKYTDSIVMWEDKVLYAVWQYEDDPQYGAFRVTKRVTALEADKPAPTDAEATFDFTVTLKAADGTPLAGTFFYQIYDGQSAQQASGQIADGGTIQLQDGWFIIIEDLPEKTLCTVTESAVPNSYFRPVDKTKTREVLGGNTARATIENIYAEIAETQTWYTVKHYLQDQQGNYSENPNFQEILIGDKGAQTNAQRKLAEGYVLDGGKHPQGIEQKTIAEDGSTVIEIYYARSKYPYIVRYLEQGTDKVLATEKTGESQIFGTTVTEAAVEISGYTCVTSSPQSIRIQVEDSIQKNVITFYYTENQVEIRYEAVGEGTVSLEAEQVLVHSGTPQGSIPTPKDGYKFVGWYADPDCTILVSDDWVEDDDKLVPQKDETQNMYVAATYYAKFQRKVGNLQLTKVVDNGDSQHSIHVQEFTFVVTGDAIITGESYKVQKDSVTEEVTVTENPENKGAQEIQVKLKAGETLTILGLPEGTYQVAEVPGYGYQGTLTADKAVIVDNQTVEITCTNVPAYTGNLTLTKTVTQDYEKDMLPDDNFSFTISFKPHEEAFQGRTYPYTVKIGDQEIQGTLYSADDIIKVTLSHGQTAKITGLPVGSYRIVEAVDATAYATTSTGEEGTIEAGVTAAAAFTNQYQRHRGDLVIEKVVRKEYADDAWNSDTFTFVIEGTALLADGEYTILVNGVEEQIQVQDQKVHMEKSILVAEAELGKTVSLILADLPVGTYTVTETKMEAYLTTVPDEAGNQVEENRITVTVAGEEAAAAARFLNTYKRTEGNLTICKEIQIAEGSTEVIRQEDVFTFMVQMPDGTKFAGCKYQTAGLEGITEVEVNAEGKLTVQLKHGQSVTISGLPVGSYVVSEAQLYDYGIDMGSGAASMEVNVKTNETTKVNCVNTYPIHRGTLTITKQNAADPEQVFIYEVTNSKGEVITVTVVGNGSTTIYDVPFDTYTVKQVNDWSWRYADTQQSVEIQDNAEYTVVFDDVIQDVQWLDDNSPMIRNRKKEEEDTAG